MVRSNPLSDTNLPAKIIIKPIFIVFLRIHPKSCVATEGATLNFAFQGARMDGTGSFMQRIWSAFVFV
ncbi:MAG: hypothetical protein IPQ18_14740 [Saprospiraceae bacterium]|nr:hypothetical protein [Saprospiraceae bacterium]